MISDLPENLQPQDFFQVLNLIAKTAKINVTSGIREWGESVMRVQTSNYTASSLTKKHDIFMAQRPVLFIMAGTHLQKYQVRLSMTEAMPRDQLRDRFLLKKQLLGLMDHMKEKLGNLRDVGEEDSSMSFVRWLGLSATTAKGDDDSDGIDNVTEKFEQVSAPRTLPPSPVLCPPLSQYSSNNKHFLPQILYFLSPGEKKSERRDEAPGYAPEWHL